MRTERFVVLWFPPEGDRERKFNTEAAARKFLDTPNEYGELEAREWSPLLLHRVEIREVDETALAIHPAPETKEQQ